MCIGSLLALPMVLILFHPFGFALNIIVKPVIGTQIHPAVPADLRRTLASRTSQACLLASPRANWILLLSAPLVAPLPFNPQPSSLSLVMRGILLPRGLLRVRLRLLIGLFRLLRPLVRQRSGQRGSLVEQGADVAVGELWE